MKKKKPANNFDTLVEKLTQEFIKIPNFNLMSTDEGGSKLFNIIIFRIAEVSSYRDLVCQHFIPATNKIISEGRRDFQNSKHKTLLKTRDIDFNETLYDTIRLAYVGLFHKLENYINDVVKIPELIYGELYETSDPVEKWAKDKFGFDIRDWQQFYITYKINWICNCVKHKDGFPVKEPKPIGFMNVDVSQRIRIEADEFKRDCELLINFYPFYLQTISLFAQHKLIGEKPIVKEDYKYSPDLYEKQLDNVKQLDDQIWKFVEYLKNLK